MLIAAVGMAVALYSLSGKRAKCRSIRAPSRVVRAATVPRPVRHQGPRADHLG